MTTKNNVIISLWDTLPDILQIVIREHCSVNAISRNFRAKKARADIAYKLSFELIRDTAINPCIPYTHQVLKYCTNNAQRNPNLYKKWWELFLFHITYQISSVAPLTVNERENWEKTRVAKCKLSRRVLNTLEESPRPVVVFLSNEFGDDDLLYLHEDFPELCQPSPLVLTSSWME